MRALNISSKGTLSYWFRDLKLSTAAKKRLRKNVERAYQRGLLTFNERRTKTIRNENKSILHQSSKAIPRLGQKELLLIGASLYWAEGINREARKGYRLASFTNSDPTMVKVFMRYLREVLKVSDDRIKPGVIIYPNLEAEKAKGFWARTTGLAKDSFWVTVAISKASKLRKASNYLPYGTVHLRINNRQFYYRIQGQIAGITRQLQLGRKA